MSINGDNYAQVLFDKCVEDMSLSGEMVSMQTVWMRLADMVTWVKDPEDVMDQCMKIEAILDDSIEAKFHQWLVEEEEDDD